MEYWDCGLGGSVQKVKRFPGRAACRAVTHEGLEGPVSERTRGA